MKTFPSATLERCRADGYKVTVLNRHARTAVAERSSAASGS